jgi:hypothetical protein
MFEFDSVYFDTEPLVSSRWPHISVPLKRILFFAGRYGIDLFLPAATEMELEEHWYREFVGLRDVSTASALKLSRFLKNVSVGPLTLNVPDEVSARDRYRAAVQGVKTNWGIQTIPLAGRSVEELFGMAIRQTPPFKEEGAGFQDTVIYTSVVDYLRETGRSGAYVSNDGIFHKQRGRILEIAGAAGVRLRLYRTLGELEEEFKKELSDEIGRAMERDRQRAADALHTRTPEIEEFIANNVEIPKSHFPVGDVVELQSIEVIRIEYVMTSYPRESEPTDISFQAVIKAHVLMDTSPYSFFMRAFTHKADTESIDDTEDPPKIITHALEYRVEVEATGLVDEDQFTYVRLLSAKIKTY